MRDATSTSDPVKPYGVALPIVSRARFPPSPSASRFRFPLPGIPRTPAPDPPAGRPRPRHRTTAEPARRVSPIAARRSGGTDAWVIPAGWLISDSTPPSDSASANTRTRSSTCAARSRVSELDADHSAEAGHLPARQIVLRMRRQADVEHVLVADLLDQPLRDLASVHVVLAHAEVQRLRAAQREPGVERTGDRAGGVVNELAAARRARRRARRRSRRSCRCGRSGTSSSSGRRCRRRARAAAGSTATRTCCRR